MKTYSLNVAEMNLKGNLVHLCRIEGIESLEKARYIREILRGSDLITDNDEIVITEWTPAVGKDVE